MSNYYVVATAKHTLNLRGKQYKIGESIPTELTEKEYEFYKDALNVESVTKNSEQGALDTLNAYKNIAKDNEAELKAELERLKAENEKLKAINLAGLPKPKMSETNIQKCEMPTETEVKPKRPYAKKETK